MPSLNTQQQKSFKLQDSEDKINKMMHEKLLKLFCIKFFSTILQLDHLSIH